MRLRATTPHVRPCMSRRITNMHLATGADVYSSNIAEKEAENTYEYSLLCILLKLYSMKTLRRALMAEAEAGGPTL